MVNCGCATGRTFDTPLVVRIPDARLAWCKTGLQVIIFIYVFIEIVFYHQANDFRTPHGVYNTWMQVFGGMDTTANNNKTYCNNDDYAFVVTNEHDKLKAGDFEVNSPGCVHLPFTSIWHGRTDGLDILSMTGTTTVDKGAFAKNLEFSFVSNMDDFFFFVQHSASRDGLDTMHVPPTKWLYNDGSVYKTTKKNEILAISIKDLEAMAGRTVDDENFQSTFVDTKSPRYRLTGAIILLKVKFDNYKPWNVYEDEFCELSVDWLEGQWGFMSAHSTPYFQQLPNGTVVEKSRYQFKNGLRITFVTSGEFGVFSLPSFVIFLMTGFGLFRLAHWLVDKTATYLCQVFSPRFSVEYCAMKYVPASVVDNRVRGAAKEFDRINDKFARDSADVRMDSVGK